MSAHNPPRFGTDGMRGLANTELTPEHVLALGRVAAGVFAQEVGHPPTIVIGEDTRASSHMLRAALSAGIASGGGTVLECGVVPTAGVALLARTLGADAGAVVSASHNPASDNGVKFFAAGGQKVPDHVEADIQACLDAAVDTQSAPAVGSVSADQVGALRVTHELVGNYASMLLDAVSTPLSGLHVVLDCANGAGYEIAPQVFREAGCTVEACFIEPNGANINDRCGAAHPEALAARVRAVGADVGLALDGDADRLVAVDEAGRVTDGDGILAICATDMHSRGELHGDAVVATVMSNMGLRNLLARHGISVVTSDVGDRNVLVEMHKHDLVLGGEQSGHIIFRQIAPTGDGILTALELCQVIVRTKRPLSELAAEMDRVPQRLANVSLADRSVLDRADVLWNAVSDIEAELGDSGQVLVRPSGTEPKLRIMVQAPSSEVVEHYIDRLSKVARALGPTPK